MPAYPTIIIGVGTSGLRVIEQMQRFQYFTGNREQEDSEVRYVYIETDPGTKIESLPDQKYTRSVILASDYPVSDYEQLKMQGGNLDWIPDEVKDGYRSDPIRAANAMPRYGRFVLRVRFAEALTAIGDAIQNAIQSAEAINRDEADRIEEFVKTPDPVVFITGTLMGGTGSGIFVDVACMARLLNDKVDPIGLFMLPPNTQTQSENPDAVAHGNTYGALNALSLFDESLKEEGSKLQTKKLPKYKEMFPGRGECKRYESPFKLIQLISASHRTGGTMSVDSLRKVAALYLHVNRKGYIRKWLERFGEAIQNKETNQYGTFGLSGVQFPKDDITTYAAHELAMKLMGRWFHPTDFFLVRDGKYIPIGTVEADLNKKFVEELFIDSANKQATVLSQIRQRFDKDLDDIFKEIQNRNTNIPKYLAKKFGWDSLDGLYSAVGSMVKTTEDELIGLVAERNRYYCQTFESVTLAEKALVKLGKRMIDIANFWRQQGAGNWEDVVKTAIKDFPRHPPLWVDAGQMASIQRERLESLFSLLTKHHLLATLDSIGQDVQSETVQVPKKGKDGLVLPHKGLYTLIRKKIAPVLVPKATTESEKKVNLAFQQKRVYDEVHDPNVPFERVYPAASLGDGKDKSPFVREADRAVAVFESQVLKTSSDKQPCYKYEDLRPVLESPPADLWDLLNIWTTEAYKYLITGYEQLLRNHDCVRSYDVAEHLLNNVGTITSIARRASEPLLHLRPDMRLNLNPKGTGPAMKVERVKVVMGADESKLSQLLQKLRDNGVTEFPNEPDNKAVMADMENFTFFFKQFANFKPLTDLADAAALEKMYKNGQLVEPTPDPSFERERTAYFPVREPLELPPGQQSS